MVYTIGTGATPSFPSIGSGATPSFSTAKIGSGARPTFSAPRSTISSSRPVAINIGNHSTGHRHHHHYHHSSSQSSSSSTTKCTDTSVAIYCIIGTIVFVIFVVLVVAYIIDPSSENRENLGDFLDSIVNN